MTEVYLNMLYVIGTGFLWLAVFFLVQKFYEKS